MGFLGIINKSWWMAIIPIILLYGGLMFYFSMNMRSNFFLKSTIRLPDERVMLSFDDGPHPIITPQILDILLKHNIHAMFFLIGKQIEAHPSIVERIVREGHMIGGHSYSHSNTFGLLNSKKVEAEIMRAQELIETFGGNKLLFRPPFGVTNPRIAAVVKRHSLVTIGWTCRSYDTITKDAPKLLLRLKRKIRPGDIILLHDRIPQTLQVLDEFISWAKSENFEFGLLNVKKNGRH